MPTGYSGAIQGVADRQRAHRVGYVLLSSTQLPSPLLSSNPTREQQRTHPARCSSAFITFRLIFGSYDVRCLREHANEPKRTTSDNTDMTDASAHSSGLVVTVVSNRTPQHMIHSYRRHYYSCVSVLTGKGLAFDHALVYVSSFPTHTGCMCD